MSLLSTDRLECANVRYLGGNDSHFVQVTDCFLLENVSLSADLGK